MTKTATRPAKAAASTAATMSALDAHTARVTAAASTASMEGYRYGVAEARAQAAVATVIGLHDNNDLIARATFSYGYVVAYLLRWNRSAKAVEAAKADNSGWAPVYEGDKLVNFPEGFGEKMLAYGKALVLSGKAPKTQKIRNGQFRMTEFEHAATKAATSAWHRVAPPKLTGEETPNATRKPRAAGSTKTKDAEITFAQMLEPKRLPKVNGAKAVCELVFKLASLEAALAKKHANELPLALKEAIAALDKAARETWEGVKDA